MGINLYDKNGWVDIEKIDKISKNCVWTIMIGARAIGKTFSMCSHLINHPDGQFLFLRRTQKQYQLISNNLTNPFVPVIREGMCPELITVPIPKTQDITSIHRCEYNEEEDKMEPTGEPVGFFSSVLGFHNIRGISLPGVNRIVVDEFIDEKSSRKVKGEWDSYVNLIESVKRNRFLSDPNAHLKVYLMSNANDLSSPVLEGLGLVNQAYKMQETGQMVYVNDKTHICLIMFQNSPISQRKSKDPFYESLTTDANEEFKAMALDNKFNLGTTALIKSCNLKEFTPICTVAKMTIYQHKSEPFYYVSPTKIGTCPVYGNTETELLRFQNNNGGLWIAYLHNQIYFETVAEEVKFLSVFD